MIKKLKILVALIVLATIAWLAFPHYWNHTANYVVTKAERVQQPDGSNKYLVFTQESTFTVSDDARILRFNSSDVYAKIVPGSYKITHYGPRLGLMSWYPNIKQIEKVK